MATHGLCHGTTMAPRQERRKRNKRGIKKLLPLRSGDCKGGNRKDKFAGASPAD